MPNVVGPYENAVVESLTSTIENDSRQYMFSFPKCEEALLYLTVSSSSYDIQSHW